MRSRAGFTLIELSIVILVIALLTAGIIAGRSLIRAAELREMVSEYDRHVKAIQEFQDKYNQLPGDMTNATTYWGTDTCPTSAASSPKIATCNGSGDGKIGTSTATGTVTAGPGATSEEWFRAWQHLADAGLITGIYSGTQGSAGALQAVVGTNIPQSKVSNAGWLLMYFLTTSTSSDIWGDNYGHIFQFGAGNTTNDRNTAPALTPSEALDLDMKLDDGTPGSGKIRSWRTNKNANCTENDSSQTNATYKTSYTSPACAPFFITGF